MLVYLGWSSRAAVQAEKAISAHADQHWPDYARLIAELTPVAAGDTDNDAAIDEQPAVAAKAKVFPDAGNADILAVRMAIPAMAKVAYYEQHRRTFGSAKEPVSTACSRYLSALGDEADLKGMRLQLVGLGLRTFLPKLFAAAAICGKPLPSRFIDPVNFIDLCDYTADSSLFLRQRSEYVHEDSRQDLVEIAASVTAKGHYTDAGLMLRASISVATTLGFTDNDQHQPQLT